MTSAKPTTAETLILGAGPAGLQLGHHLAEAGRDYLILEAGERAGTFFEKFPRHRQLISINKPYTGYDDPEINLRWDWNSILSDREDLRLTRYSKKYFPAADTLVDYLNDYAEQLEIKVRYGTQITEVKKQDGIFELTDAEGHVYSALRVVVATGLSNPYIPPIDGIEDVPSYCEVSVEPEDFANHRVLIIGKGNSAFETADNLIPTAALIHLVSPNSVKFAWQTHFVGNLRAVNNNLLDTYQLKSQNASLDADVDKIEKLDDGTFAVSFSYKHAHGEQETMIYDSVINCAGFRFDHSIYDESCRPERTECGRLPLQTSSWESSNVEHLYFAGTLMQMLDYKKCTSGFIHGFRYNVRALHRIFEERYHDVPWPRREIATNIEDVTSALLDRANTTSALWQLFGFLTDLVVVSEDDGKAYYYEEVPEGFIRDSVWGKEKHFYTLTLEYGEDHVFANPFAVERIAKHDIKRSEQSQFLHPIIRRYREGELVAEHHVIEDLLAEWKEPEHVEPLRAFLAEHMATKGVAA